MGLVPETLRIDLVDVLGAEGLAANQPFSTRLLTPPIGALFPGAWVSTLLDAVAGERGRAYLRLVEFRELFLLGRRRGRVHPIRERLAQVTRESAVGLAGIAAAPGGDLGGEQRGTMPSLSVLQAPPSCRRNEAPALSSAAEPEISRYRPSTNHFEPDRHFVQPPLQARGHPVDHRAAHDGLADAGDPFPRALPEQVVNRDGQVVIGRQQTAALGPRFRAGRDPYRRRRRCRRYP